MSTFDKKQMDAIVNRFLGWKLPETFGPDCYVSFDREKAKANNGWPIGTNLLTADEAQQMFQHALADEASILEWLFANCRIVYHPPGGQYPIEHNPHALGYDKDGTSFLSFTAPYRPPGVPPSPQYQQEQPR